MATLNIPTLDAIREAREAGLVSIRGGNTIIVNYTPKAQFNKVWTPVTTVCRGLILRVDRPWPHSTKVEYVAALPMEKFWNVYEDGRLPSSPVRDVTEKADGSLGILWRDDGSDLRIATRGSLSSNQALWATEHLKRYEGRWSIPSNYTPLFEIIYPGNRVVLDYGKREDLILLGVRDRFTGDDLPYSDVADFADEYGFSVIPRVQISLDEALAQAPSLAGTSEGWVLRCEDGTRWKVKGLTYRMIHKFLIHVSERSVLDTMLDGTCDEFLSQTPPYYRDQIIQWQNGIADAANARIDQIEGIYETGPLEGTRKEFALWATHVDRRDITSYLFALYDKRDIMPMVLKAMREYLSPNTLVSPNE